MSHISRMLAWNYLRFKGKDTPISVMITVCFIGIFIGTFALMMTLIITHGFETAIHKKMQGINAQAVMYASGNRLSYHELTTVLKKEFGNNLSGISGSCVKQAIIDHEKTQTVIFLKGIDPLHEATVTNVAEKITTPVNHLPAVQKLTTLIQEKNIIIGYKLAQQLKVTVGDQITLMFPEAGGKKRISLREETVTISGIFNIGLEEYDNNFAYTDLNYLNLMFEEEGVDTIALNFACPHQNFYQKIISLWNNEYNEKQLITALQGRFPTITVHSWKDLYPALVSSLKLEKYVMFLIIALITLVAAMNMISLLFMQVQQKRHDIAIYLAMGMQQKVIRGIFLRIGLIITCAASTLGLICAGTLGYFLEHYPFIQLPDVYYISYLPAKVEWELFVIVFATTILIGFLATWLPTAQTKRINIAQVLRQL